MSFTMRDLKCLRCGTGMVFDQERLLVDRPIGAVVQQWLHAWVYICPTCGYLELYGPSGAQKGDLDESAELPTESDFEEVSEEERREALIRLGIVPVPDELTGDGTNLISPREEEETTLSDE